MGAIFSRPVTWVKEKIRQKVDNTKAAINTKIDNTKNAIKQRIDNTKNAITTKVDNTKNAIKTKVNNTTNAICTKVTNTRDGIVDRVNRVRTSVNNAKNAVVSRVNDFREGVHRRYCSTKAAFVNACNTVKTKYVNTKNAIQTKYTNTKNRVIDTYRRVRNAKLTRAQKIKYGILLLFIFIWLSIGFVILLDLYLGDYEAAEWKVEAVKAFIRNVGVLLWEVSINCIHYAYIGGQYVCRGLKIAGIHLWEWTKVFGAHAWEATQVGGEYFLYGTTVLGEYIVHASKVASKYAYNTGKVGAEYVAQGAQVGAEYVVEGSQVAWEYGCYGAKEGAIHLWQGIKYVAINVAIGTYHGAIQVFDVTRMCVWGLLTGSYSGTAMIMDASKFIANKTYHGSIATAQFTYVTATTAWEWACITGALIMHWSTIGADSFMKGSTKAAIYTYESIYSGTIIVWESTGSSCVFIYKWSAIIIDKIVMTTVNVSTFVWVWGHWIVTSGSKGLYYGLNQFGLKWLYAFSAGTAKWGGILGAILVKFFTDLGMYLWNFLYVTGMHVYNVLYIVLAFLSGILSALMGLVKVNVDGVVYCVKLIFRGIIWVLEETVLAYMYMLHKYNMYREILFLAFLGLITCYCSGLIRDRRQSLESSSEDEDGEEAEAEQLRTKVRVDTKQRNLPPIYEHPEMPDYHSSEDEFDFEPEADLNVGGLTESEEEDESLEGLRKGQKREEKSRAWSQNKGTDSDMLSDDSLEQMETSEPESDSERVNKKDEERKIIHLRHLGGGTRLRKISDRAADADDEGGPSDPDLGADSPSDQAVDSPSSDFDPVLGPAPCDSAQEGDIPGRYPERELPESDTGFQSPELEGSEKSDPEPHERHTDTPASETDYDVGTPASDIFAHVLGKRGTFNVDTPESEASPSVGTPASDIFAHVLGKRGTFNVDTPESEASPSVGTPASDIFAHVLGKSGSTLSPGIDTPGSDISHIATPASDTGLGSGTPASDFSHSMGTPASDFFAGHHLGTPGSDFSHGISTPGSDFGIGTPASDLERRGLRIFEHGLEGQSDLDSLEAVPTVSDSDAELELEPKEIVKKLICRKARDSGEESDMESDPDQEETLKERVEAIKGRKAHKQFLSAHIDSDNVESPMSPASPLSPMTPEDDKSCDTDSLQNLLVAGSGDEADDSLKISSALSDDFCGDSLGGDSAQSEDVMSTDSIPAGTGPLDNTDAQSDQSLSPSDHNVDNSQQGHATFDNQESSGTLSGQSLDIQGELISGQTFDNQRESVQEPSLDNQQIPKRDDLGTTSTNLSACSSRTEEHFDNQDLLSETSCDNGRHAADYDPNQPPSHS